MKQKNQVYDYITNTIIKNLENKNLEWLKNWSLGFGKSHITGKEYTSINALMLNISLHHRGYKSNEWLTFNQIKQKKAKLRKGAKGTQIIFYKQNELCSCKKFNCKIKSPNHEKTPFPLLRYYNVFNLDDTNLKPKWTKDNKSNKPIKEIEDFLSAYWNLEELRYGDPAYNPRFDYIKMPKIENFDTPKDYYSALTHELVHSTGHKKRLNRIGITQTDKDKKIYAFEELIAELGSAFLCARLGLNKDIKNTSAYIQSWLKILKNDNKAVFEASKKAKDSLKYIEECTEDVEKSIVAVNQQIAEIIDKRRKLEVTL